MRIPLIFDGGTPADVYLAQGDAAVPDGAYVVRFSLPAAFGHVVGCACCTPRGPAAEALTALFRARATGEAPFFSRLVVLASPAGEAAVRDAVEHDVLALARFSLQAGE